MLMLADVMNEGVLIPAIIAASVIAVVAIKTSGSVARSHAREKSRREIAAYIAEGSMTPEQGERLMKAGGENS